MPPSVLPLDWLPEKPFSISSIHNTQGAMASAVWMTERRLASDWPTMPPKTRPMSRRSSGRPKAPAVALAVRRFAGAGDADDEQALGRGQAVGFGGFAEGTAAAYEPILEQAEPADVVERGGGFHDFDQSVLLQGAGLLAGDDLVVDALGFHHGQGEGVFRLGGGEAERALQRGFPDHFVGVS